MDIKTLYHKANIFKRVWPRQYLSTHLNTNPLAGIQKISTSYKFPLRKTVGKNQTEF